MVLYEALTGRTPAQGERVDEIINSTLNEEPLMPSEIAPSIPPLLEEAVMLCIQKKKENRVQKAGELVRLLQRNWALV